MATGAKDAWAVLARKSELNSINLAIDDDTALASLVELLSSDTSGVSLADTTINGSEMTRLDYPVLQALIAVVQHFHESKVSLTFSQFDHLQSALNRYGIAGLQAGGLALRRPTIDPHHSMLA